MPRQESVLSVFVASPEDVVDERTRLEEVVSELNVTWSRELGIRLDLVRWETHSFPGIAGDAQEVINDQIPNDFDLFIGIMWCRYGTPTGRAGSGTAEEFKRAKARHDADPSSVQIMVYFKDKAVTPSSLDLTQYSQVNEFRESLGDEGVLYQSFETVDHFEKLVRLHLARQVQVFGNRSPSILAAAVEGASVESADEEEELGILELLEIFEDRSADLNSILERIGDATEEIGNKMSERADEVKELTRISQGAVSRNSAKRLVARAAVDMDQYTAHVDAEIPLFREAFNTAIDAYMRYLSINVTLEPDEETLEQAKDTLEAIITLGGTLEFVREELSEFRKVFAGMVPLTSKLNKAKRGVVRVVDQLCSDISAQQALLREGEAMMRDFLGRHDN